MDFRNVPNIIIHFHQGFQILYSIDVAEVRIIIVSNQWRQLLVEHVGIVGGRHWHHASFFSKEFHISLFLLFLFLRQSEVHHMSHLWFLDFSSLSIIRRFCQEHLDIHTESGTGSMMLLDIPFCDIFIRPKILFNSLQLL